MRLKSFFVSVLVAGFLSCAAARAEVILQFFNNTWNEIADEIPEIAEVGYTGLWLPPPQKASGGLSVGYDLWDPFDLGSVDQRSTIKTRYGTEKDLLRLIETAHRFGIRVYFDNIMNHRAFDVPGYNENTPIDIYPGMLPEDFHLRVTEPRGPAGRDICRACSRPCHGRHAQERGPKQLVHPEVLRTSQCSRDSRVVSTWPVL